MQPQDPNQLNNNPQPQPVEQPVPQFEQQADPQYQQPVQTIQPAQFEQSTVQPQQPIQPEQPLSQQPMPPQQQFNPAANNVAQPAYPSAAYGVDPGKSLSLAGLVVAIVLPIVGIPMAAIGMTKSKSAGYSGKLGKIGIIVGIISAIVISILAFVLPYIAAKNATDDFREATSSLNAPKDTIDSTATVADKKPNPEPAVTSRGQLAKGMTKAEVEKAIGMTGVCQKPTPTTEICTYKDASGLYDAIVTFKNGTLNTAGVVEGTKITQQIK